MALCLTFSTQYVIMNIIGYDRGYPTICNIFTCIYSLGKTSIGPIAFKSPFHWWKYSVWLQLNMLISTDL